MEQTERPPHKVRFCDLLEGFLEVSLTLVIQAAPPQVSMGCRSAAPSIKRMVVTLPSGGACSRSQIAAPRLLPLRRTPTCWPDTLASVNRWSLHCSLTVTNWNTESLLMHVSLSTEWTGAYRGAGDPSWWRPRPAALPVRHRKGWFQLNGSTVVEISKLLWWQICPIYV